MEIIVAHIATIYYIQFFSTSEHTDRVYFPFLCIREGHMP